MMADSEGFSSRKRSFEARFAHDEQRQFQALARACRRSGEWAAERLARDASGAALRVDKAAGYAMRKEGWDALEVMLAAELSELMSERQVRLAMEDLLDTAAQEVSSEGH